MSLFSEDISAAILAGGKNKRMGENKSFIRIRGVAIIQREIDALKDIFEEVVIVTNSPKDYKDYEKDCRIITDKIKDAGPLGGIFSALSYAGGRGVFFAACDMPNLHIGLIKREVTLFREGRYDCVVPLNRGMPEPLHAVYARKTAPKIYSSVRKKCLGVNEFLKKCKCGFIEAVEEELASFANLNTMEDVKKYADEKFRQLFGRI